MPNAIGRLRALVTLPLAAAALGSALPAEASTPKSHATYSWSTPTVKAGHLNDDLIAKINSIRPGGSLDVILYSDNQKAMTDAVLAAAARDVNVRVLTSHAKPDGEDEGVPLWGEIERLVKGLKKYKNAKVVVGWGSLSRSGTAGIEHRKLVLIDDGRGHHWTISDSGNWVGATDKTAFNDRLTVDDLQMWSGARKHFDILAKDRDVKTSSGAVVRTADRVRTLYFLPEANVDPWLDYLERTTGRKGCLVQDSTFYLTKGDKDTRRGSGRRWAAALGRLARQHATVQVAANDAKWSTDLRAQLKKDGVEVIDVNQGDTYMHRKSGSSSGCAGGSFGVQGSTTRNMTAFDKNGNQVMTTTSAADVHAMQTGFRLMASKGRALS